LRDFNELVGQIVTDWRIEEVHMNEPVRSPKHTGASDKRARRDANETDLPMASAPRSAPAARTVGQQGQLFTDDVIAVPEGVGVRGRSACAAAGITYRQLDYWGRTGLVRPSIRSAHGSGTQRLYSFRDIVVLKIVKRLLDIGVSLQQIRRVVQYLHNRSAAELSQITLMSDGATVCECSSLDELVGLLQDGQGFLSIAVGRVSREVEESFIQLPSEHEPRSRAADELARGRRTRQLDKPALPPPQ
jgi:DNA-binding transcriptional MerR regulator